jgi:hypothetical protein
MNSPLTYDDSTLVFVKAPTDHILREKLMEKISSATLPEEVSVHDLSEQLGGEFISRFVVPYLCISVRPKELIILEAKSSQVAAKVKTVLSPEDGLGVIKSLYKSVASQALELFGQLEGQCEKIVQRKIEQDNAWGRKNRALTYLNFAQIQAPEHASQLAPVIEQLESERKTAEEQYSEIRKNCVDLKGQFVKLIDLLSVAKITESQSAPDFLQTWHKAVAKFATISLPRLHGVEVANLLQEEFDNRTPAPAESD